MTRPASDRGPLLTGHEREAVRMAGLLYTFIADNVCGNGPTRDDDLAELRVSIHHVQNWVKAQAAGRAYPGELRLMGEAIGGAPGSEMIERRPGELPGEDLADDPGL